MPRRRHQHRSRRHLDTCSLHPGNRRPTEIEGMYFTDRYPQGDVKMTLLGRDTDAGGFDEAARRHAELTAAEKAKK